MQWIFLDSDHLATRKQCLCWKQSLLCTMSKSHRVGALPTAQPPGAPPALWAGPSPGLSPLWGEGLSPSQWHWQVQCLAQQAQDREGHHRSTAHRDLGQVMILTAGYLSEGHKRQMTFIASTPSPKKRPQLKIQLQSTFKNSLLYLKTHVRHVTHAMTTKTPNSSLPSPASHLSTVALSLGCALPTAGACSWVAIARPEASRASRLHHVHTQLAALPGGSIPHSGSFKYVTWSSKSMFKIYLYVLPATEGLTVILPAAMSLLLQDAWYLCAFGTGGCRSAEVGVSSSLIRPCWRSAVMRSQLCTAAARCLCFWDCF